jgi:BASS family bile acid:Na+ symporter
VATWLATLVLDLPPNIEAAMILVACCPGGSLSNVVTHFGRGNTALSVSISAVAALMALLLTPLNFTWMVSTNPATAGWLRTLDIDASAIWWSLLALLALPMVAGLDGDAPSAGAGRAHPQAAGQLQPAGAAGLHRAGPGERTPPAHRSTAAATGCGGAAQRGRAGAGLAGRPVLLAWTSATAAPSPSKAACRIRAWRLGIIAVQFNAELGMVIVASLWGMWHIVSGMTLATLWRRKDARLGH